ncbi:Veg family protein [Caldanaerobius polysaccharolyticus]|uniref:Veg family protein n=1 Tax=Caldanaerobius polysaccharolyticus TaxID=44256 RepID=UPI000553B809|nr:Veg family protein [Caldanaerobius polysaccharolyticus]
MSVADKSALIAIKRDIDNHIGERVQLKTNGGRKKTVIREGILEKTYPSIFVVRLDAPGMCRRVTFSYSDILTETIELTLVNDNRKIACM